MSRFAVVSGGAGGGASGAGATVVASVMPPPIVAGIRPLGSGRYWSGVSVSLPAATPSRVEFESLSRLNDQAAPPPPSSTAPTTATAIALRTLIVRGRFAAAFVAGADAIGSTAR